MAHKPRSASQSQQLPPSMKQVHLNAAGIDVGAESHYVAVPACYEALFSGKCELNMKNHFVGSVYGLALAHQECPELAVKLKNKKRYQIQSAKS